MEGKYYLFRTINEIEHFIQSELAMGPMMQKQPFCGKTQKEVFKLLEGIDGVHICDACVDLSASLLVKGT